MVRRHPRNPLNKKENFQKKNASFLGRLAVQRCFIDIRVMLHKEDGGPEVFYRNLKLFLAKKTSRSSFQIHRKVSLFSDYCPEVFALKKNFLRELLEVFFINKNF